MKRSIVFFWLLTLEISFVMSQKGLDNLVLQILKRQSTKCQEKVEITDEDVNKTLKGIFEMNNEKQGCYLKCLLNEVYLMDEKGQMTPEEAAKVFGPEKILRYSPAFKVCGVLDDANSCFKALKIGECLYDYLSEED